MLWCGLPVAHVLPNRYCPKVRARIIRSRPLSIRLERGIAVIEELEGQCQCHFRSAVN